MRLNSLLAAFSIAAVLGLVEAPEVAQAAPNVPARSIDIDLKEADIVRVFGLLSKVTHRTIETDPCVQGKVDLRLKNVPVAIVFDALAAKLGLVYLDEGDGGVVRVQCSATSTRRGEPGRPDARLTKKVSIAVKDLPLDELAKQLKTLTGAEEVDYSVTTARRITLSLENVRVATLLAAVGDAADATVSLDGKRLVLKDTQ